MVKLIFKAYKKTDKIFFLSYKNVYKISSKKTKKGFQKRLVKGTKIYL